MPVRNVLLWIICVITGITACAAQQSVSLHYQVINNFPVKYVAVNLQDPEVVVTPAIATSFPNALESWGSFLDRLKPDAAINGTYFCPHSYQPVGDVALEGALVYRGSVGTALCITPDNRAVMLPGPRQAKSNWQGYRMVLCAGPRLLTDGQVTINARAEGFRDPHVLGSASRSAVAIRSDGVLLLLTIDKNISLGNLAAVCLKLGAIQAMTLDGGSSSGLYADGRTVTRPSRRVSNILAVYATHQRYAAIAQRLLPTRTPVLARLLQPSALPTEPTPVYVAITPSEVPSFTLSNAEKAPSPVTFMTPTSSGKPLHGQIPVAVKIRMDERMAWCSLRINGQFRAMSNTDTLEYLWDSRRDQDGINTLEVSVWSLDRDLLALESREVLVQNIAVVAEK